MAVFLMLTGGIAWAEDVDIFGGTEINVPPNVLIIFDNSGSMDEPTNTNLPETPYVWSTVYSGSFLMRRIYYWSDSRGTWLEWEDIGSDGWTDSSEVYCDDAREAINLEGYWKGMIFDGWWWFRNHPCGTWFDSYRMLRSGNYLNYLSQGGSQQRIKLDLAKEVVIDAVQSTPGVRFGIMIFNSDNDGGSILQPIGASTQDIVNSINSINAHTSTPLAETLAEAGLYFGGLPSWANSGRYTSPIQYRCQKNHVIIMTDGEPTYDSGSLSAIMMPTGMIRAAISSAAATTWMMWPNIFMMWTCWTVPARMTAGSLFSTTTRLQRIMKSLRSRISSPIRSVLRSIISCWRTRPAIVWMLKAIRRATTLQPRTT